MRNASGRGEMAQPGMMRGAEDPLERAGERGLLQRREDPAAVVVDHNDGEVGTGFVRAEEQARRIVQDGEIAEQRGGPAAASPLVGQGGPIAADTSPSIPLAPLLPSTRRPERGAR